MGEFNIGEGMSKVTDLDAVIEGPDGELYESEAHIAMKRPLDFGRSLYVRLRWAFDEDYEVEVLWDHYKNLLIAIVQFLDERFIAHMRGEKAVDPSRVKVIQTFVDEMKGRVDG